MATRKKTAKKAAAGRAKAKPPARKAPPSRRAPARRAAPTRAKAGTTGFAGASPSYTVNDLQKSIAFYRDVLGFSEGQRWERDGELRGIEMKSGDVTVMLGQDDWQKGRDRKKGEGFRIYFVTTRDVGALAEGMKARGATLDEEPRAEQWGSFFTLTDPDGFKITVLNEKARR